MNADSSGPGRDGYVPSGPPASAGSRSGAGRPSARLERVEGPPAARAKTTAKAGGAAGNRRPRSRARVPESVGREIVRITGPAAAPIVEKRLAKAAEAFEADRPQDAYRLLRPVLTQLASVPAASELAGLALYRMGRWNDAVRQLEASRKLSGSVEILPVLADAYRALGRYQQADDLWEELRGASPAPAVLTEGRIVAAGGLADQGQVAEAIRLLERGRPNSSQTTGQRRGARAALRSGENRAPRVADYQVRLWYALADLYERAGNTPAARELFGRIVAAEPGFADAADRLGGLR